MGAAMTVSHDARGRRLSEGRRLLLLALQRMTHRDLARRCRCSRSAITRLAGGEPTDSYRLRRALETVAGIPMRAWDEPATPDDALGPEMNRGPCETTPAGGANAA